MKAIHKVTEVLAEVGRWTGLSPVTAEILAAPAIVHYSYGSIYAGSQPRR